VHFARIVFEAGVHRSHDDAVSQREEAEVERGEQVGIGRHPAAMPDCGDGSKRNADGDRMIRAPGLPRSDRLKRFPSAQGQTGGTSRSRGEGLDEVSGDDPPCRRRHACV